MLDVLQNSQQFRDARRALRQSNRSGLETKLFRILRILGLKTSLPVGDNIKSWDVLRTLDLIEQKLSRDSDILDIGAFCSEIPVSLAMMGYSNVHGIDLNPRVREMPYSIKVHYKMGNFMNTSYRDASFDAITAISVIEHGYEPNALFREMGRLLRPGGLFIASFDYWPEKIDTANVKFFDLSWLIFSRDDYISMLEVAARYGLYPIEKGIPQAGTHAVRCGGFAYTFAWTALQKC